MKYKLILCLPLILISCSDDKPKPSMAPGSVPPASVVPSRAPASKPVDKTVVQKPLAPSQQPKVIPAPISPEIIYTEKMKKKPEVWYLAELGSFAFIAKKQIDLAREIKNEGSLYWPLYRYKFLTQLHGIRTVLSYMRMILNRVNRGDTGVIRSHTLEAIRMSYAAKKTTHVGEALLFAEGAKDAYLKVNELCNRELLKPLLPAPFVPSSLRVNIHKAFDHVQNIFDDLEGLETAEEKTLTENVLLHFLQIQREIYQIQEQTDGLGYMMNSTLFPEDVKRKTKKTLMNGTTMGDMKSVSNTYGLPSASSLLHAGKAMPQHHSGSMPQNYSGAMPMNAPIDSTSVRVSDVLATEAARGPYGISALGPVPPSNPAINPGVANLPPLGALGGNTYPGAPQPQPSLPLMPAEIPPLPLPPPTPGAAGR